MGYRNWASTERILFLTGSTPGWTLVMVSTLVGPSNRGNHGRVNKLSRFSWVKWVEWTDSVHHVGNRLYPYVASRGRDWCPLCTYLLCIYIYRVILYWISSRYTEFTEGYRGVNSGRSCVVRNQVFKFE